MHLRVTSAGLPRAVGVLDALVRALEASGHAVSWPNGPRAKLTALVQGEEIALRIVESVRLGPGILTKTGSRRRDPPKLEYRTSKLILYLQSVEFYQVARKRADGKRERIEDCLEEIVLEFTRTADAIKEARAVLDRQHRALEAQRLLEKEARERRELYLRKSAVIKKAAHSLEMSQSIRGLVVCLGSMAKMDDLTHEQLVRFKEMLQWCTEYADSLDPTNRLRDVVEEFSNPPALSTSR